MTILSAAVSSTRTSRDLDEVAVGDLLPVRVVVVGFAGQHDAVGPAQHRQGVAPRGGEQSRTVGGQDVQPGIGVGRADLGDRCRPARRGRGRRSARPAARCRRSIRAAARRGSTARSTRPLCDSSHCPSVNGADADGSIGMPTRGRAHRGHHASAAQRGRHRRERRVTPQRRGAAPAPRRRSPSKKPTPQPSAFIRPCFCRRGEYDCTSRPYGGSSTSDATEPAAPSQPRCRHIRRPRPAGRRRRSAGGSGGPSCGSWAAGCRRRPPTSRRAAPCSRRRRTAAL